MEESKDDKFKVSKLQPIEKNRQDILETVLTNTVKMITNRGVLPKKDLDKNINKLISDHSDDMLYVLDNYIIKIIPQNITTINKASGISALLQKYKDNHIIVIVKNVSKKVLNEIGLRYLNTEVFLEKEQMINIVDYDIVPEHSLLNEEDTNSFFEIYNVNKKNMPKIHKTDPVARYYNAKVGNIFKITRPSEASGIIHTYRIVI